ncbi:MAG: sugar phosphate isomerase/epimerase [Bacteroidetes bacterium]|nr:sugar phosphate isomerase/epimerase [Bacteroidota bacterium]MBS1648375.1 sugar phosphate isomerase/epimerase [Bacteroidota bacterium]
MQHSRRNFIKLSGLSALALSSPIKKISLLNNNFSTKPINAFGIQLWTVKEDMATNAKDTLKQLANYGYKQIESFEGKEGIFWGMKNTEFKKYVDDIGTKIVATHCDISKDFEKKAAEAAAIDMKYLICPWVGSQKHIDDFKKIADKFNKCGEICKKNGIRFAYHNHDYSFKPVDEQLPQEVLMNNTDASLVDFEMDIYWVVVAGQNPEEWLKKYKNRFRSCHIKDRIKNTTGETSCILGTGNINFREILKTAKTNGMQYYIVEQEAFANTTPLKSAEANAVYMKALSI